MAFGALPEDSGGIPISSVYVPGVGFIALAGNTSTSTDGSGNTSTSAVMSLTQASVVSGSLQSAQAGNANGTALTITGSGSVLFEVIMTSYTGTVNIEGAGPNGNYDPLWVNQVGTNTIGLTVIGSSTTATHLYELANASGLQTVRARTSGTSAGTVSVNAYALPMVIGPRVVNANITSPGTVALESGGNLATIATRTPALGQATSSNSSPVVIASDQSSVGIVQKPSTSGGSSTFHVISAASNNATSIKASAGQIYGWEIYNTNAAVRYVKLYNKASAPAPASDNALLKMVIGVPPSGRAFYYSDNGIACSSGIGLAAVTGISDTDNTSVGASDLSITIEYF